MKKQVFRVYTCEKCGQDFSDRDECKRHEAACTAVEVHPEQLRVEYQNTGRTIETIATLRHRPVCHETDRFPNERIACAVECNITYDYGSRTPGDVLEMAKNKILEMLVNATTTISTLTTENIDMPITSREDYDSPPDTEGGDPMSPEAVPFVIHDGTEMAPRGITRATMRR